MYVALLAFITIAAQSEALDDIIHAVEHGDADERGRLFEILRSDARTAGAVVGRLAERTSVDAVAVWLVRLLLEAPVPADPEMRGRLLKTLQEASVRPDADRFRLLLLLDARLRVGDLTALETLRNLADDRQAPSDVRLEAGDLLLTHGQSAHGLTEFVGDERIPEEERVAAAVSLARQGNAIAIRFLKTLPREHDVVEGLAYAAATDSESATIILGMAKSGDPIAARTILRVLEVYAPGLAAEFARRYLQSERESEDPDGDETNLEIANRILARRPAEPLPPDRAVKKAKPPSVHVDETLASPSESSVPPPSRRPEPPPAEPSSRWPRVTILGIAIVAALLVIVRLWRARA